MEVSYWLESREKAPCGRRSGNKSPEASHILQIMKSGRKQNSICQLSDI